MQKTADILRLLSEHGVDFVVVGEYVLFAHGGTLVTQDLDVCCSFSPENLLRIQDALQNHHPVHRMTPQRLPLQLTKESCQGLNNIYLDTEIGQIACLGLIFGIGDFQEVKKRSFLVDMDGYEVRLLELDALIAAKINMNRPRDKEAVLQLEAPGPRERRVKNVRSRAMPPFSRAFSQSQPSVCYSETSNYRTGSFADSFADFCANL